MKVSVPGSLMLFGEHAVLNKYPAIVAAIDKRITVTLASRDDRIIKISSSLGDFETTIDNITAQQPFHFVLEAIKLFQPNIGINLKITSEFDSKLGLGSSAAVTVATIAILYFWQHNSKIQEEKLIKLAIGLIKKVQGCGSGADVAASVAGGIIFFDPEKIQYTKLASSLPICAIYSGSKVPTPEVIKFVAAEQKKNPEVYANIYAAIGTATDSAAKAIVNQELENLGKLANINHHLLAALGVSNNKLENIRQQLLAVDGISGAKISGAGLGDCIIGFGAIQKNIITDILPLKISESGVQYE